MGCLGSSVVFLVCLHKLYVIQKQPVKEENAAPLITSCKVDNYYLSVIGCLTYK